MKDFDYGGLKLGRRLAGRGVHALGGIGSIVGGVMGADAANSAAEMQAESQQKAIDEQRREFDIAQQNTQPYRDVGKRALQFSDYLMGSTGRPGYFTQQFNPGDLQNDPGYQFERQQGELGLNRAAAAAGRYDSGQTLKDLLRFNNDYAGTKFNEAFNRDQTQKNNIYNRLAGLSGLGMTGTAQVNAAGANTANNISNLLTGQGNSIASGIVGSANSIAGGFSNAANNYQSNQLLKKLFAGGGGGGGGGGAAVSGYSGSDAGMMSDLAGAGIF